MLYFAAFDAFLYAAAAIAAAAFSLFISIFAAMLLIRLLFAAAAAPFSLPLLRGVKHYVFFRFLSIRPFIRHYALLPLSLFHCCRCHYFSITFFDFSPL